LVRGVKKFGTVTLKKALSNSVNASVVDHHATQHDLVQGEQDMEPGRPAEGRRDYSLAPMPVQTPPTQPPAQPPSSRLH